MESEKNRATILAEREAKRLAKKNRTKSKKGDNVEPPNPPTDSNQSIQKPVESKPQKPVEAKPQKPEPSESTETKSKAELKAERRAKQQAQRAAKEAQTKQEKPAGKPESTARKLERPEKIEKIQPKRPSVSHELNTLQRERQLLFNHLYIDRKPSNMSEFKSLHPSVLKVGIQYLNRIVFGSNSRCIAMLNAIRDMVDEFRTSNQEEFGRSLDTCLQKCTKYWHLCRPISVSMSNALKFLKFHLTLLSNNISDHDAIASVQETITTYIREQIEVADQAISITVQPKISSGDTILTYGCSSLIETILLEANRNGKQFRVIVVDSRPWLEGREMLRRLVTAGVRCSYVFATATCAIMSQVTKVLLGAHALLANGCVMSRIGTAQVALLARAYNVPVLVCCETYKFCERVQTDSFVYNEIAESDESSVSPGVTPLNLIYDVTPPELVTAVVTELAILPCTSVPVILRIKPTDNNY